MADGGGALKKLCGKYGFYPFTIRLYDPPFGILPVYRCLKGGLVGSIRREENGTHERVRCARCVGFITILLSDK